MSALRQVRDNVTRAWDTLADGWRELRQRAAQALTPFHPVVRHGTFESFEERQARRGARWGLLAADVSDDDRKVEVTLEMPGLEPDDFRVEVIGDHLVVRGEKRITRETTRGMYHVMERAYGSFERTVPLPAAVDFEQAEARYRRGVLRVVLPKRRPAPGRRVRVARRS